MSGVRSCKRDGCGKPVKPGGTFCCRRCCYKSNVSQRQTWPVVAPRDPAPVAALTSSWWTVDLEAFYPNARRQFPLDAPEKSQQPVETFGSYGRDLLAMGRARVRDRQ